MKKKLFIATLALMLVCASAMVFAGFSNGENSMNCVEANQPNSAVDNNEARYADALGPYEGFGLTYSARADQVMYQGKQVRCIYDASRDMAYYSPKGEIDVVPVYEGGSLSDLSVASDEEVEQNNKVLSEQSGGDPANYSTIAYKDLYKRF